MPPVPPVPPTPHIDLGHTVLAVPVPALDAYVRDRTRHYDIAYLADDPMFGQAHVTLVGPWRRSPSTADLGLVNELVAATEPFDFSLTELGVFTDGTIHIAADPAAQFAGMTAELVRMFPDHQPYGGRFTDIVPHVTLDAVGVGVDVDSVRTSLGSLVPARCRAEVVQLQWWQAGHCHVQHTWQLGPRQEGNN